MTNTVSETALKRPNVFRLTIFEEQYLTGEEGKEKSSDQSVTLCVLEIEYVIAMKSLGTKDCSLCFSMTPEIH